MALIYSGPEINLARKWSEFDFEANRWDGRSCAHNKLPNDSGKLGPVRDEVTEL